MGGAISIRVLRKAEASRFKAVAISGALLAVDPAIATPIMVRVAFCARISLDARKRLADFESCRSAWPICSRHTSQS